MANVFVIAFDSNESAQIRRVRSLVALGHDVRVAAFSRGNMAGQAGMGVPVIDLGQVENGRLGRRAAGIAGALARLWPHRAALRAADVVIARNLDCLALAAAARTMAGAGQSRLVYECLDIHDAFTGKGAVGRTMRAAERALLRRTDLVLTSSPGFVRNYFGPVQGFAGPVAVVENKLWFDGPAPPRPATPRRPAPGAPLRIGWVGSIRCAPSLRILSDLADRMGHAVEIAVHGNIHRHALPGFDAALAARPNMTWHGPYRYPDDLAEIYGGLDLVWAQDLWQRGANSDWLLPNRIYEASYFGCPSIAVEGTETGRKVGADGLGLVIAQPDATVLEAVLTRLAPADVTAMSDRLLDRPATDFVLTPEALARALDPVLPVNPARATRGAAASARTEAGAGA